MVVLVVVVGRRWWGDYSKSFFNVLFGNRINHIGELHVRWIFRNLENKKQNSILKKQKTDPKDLLCSSSAVSDQDQEGKDVL